MPRKIQQRPHTLEAAYKIYRLDAQARGVTKRTLDTYEDRLRPFIRWCETQSITLLSEITPTLLRQYLIKLQDRQLAGATINGIARALRAFFNFCKAEGLIQETAMRRVAVPRPDKKILPALSSDKVESLLVACDSERDMAILLFLLDTGVRATEFISLNGGDIDLESGAVTIRQGKGRKARTVWMGIKTRRRLQRYYLERGTPKQDEPVWVSDKSGERLTDSGLRQLLRRLGDRAEVNKCSPHTLRRTCALWMLRNGASIYHVQRMLGHEDLQILRQYLDLVEHDIQAAHNQASPVDHMS